MTLVGERFVSAFGAPDPAAAPGLQFERRGSRVMWERLHEEVGAGWFRDGFLYLFGEGLEALRPCLEAWSFIVPPCDDRLIIGRNAYGMLLVLDNPSRPAQETVYVLDPFTVSYAGDSTVQLVSLIGRALPDGELRPFLDDQPYRAWRQEHGVDRLGAKNILGVKVPKGLGGQLESSNLQVEDIIAYYQTTAAIYANEFAKLNKV